MKPDLKTINEQWAGHLMGCPECRRYKPEHTASLRFVCVTGAPLIKGVLEAAAAPDLRKKRKLDRDLYKQYMKLDDERRVSKDRLRTITRYVESE